VVVPWSEARVLIEMKTVRHEGVTTHTVGILTQRRDGGFKRGLMRTRVDPQLFAYWQRFAAAIESRNV